MTSTLTSVPVLTSFQPTDEALHLRILQEQFDSKSFGKPKTVYSSNIKDQLLDFANADGSVPSLTIKLPHPSDLKEIAKTNIMVAIGTRIRLIDETISQGWWGVVRHTVLLVRVNKPTIWQLMSVCWTDGEPCPFQ